MKTKIFMLGTGSAFPSNSYNACFAIKTPRLLWLTDGGGGYGLFNALNRAGIEPGEFHHVFVTHAHTDHIFGIVWLLRKIVHLRMQGLYSGTLYVYANQETAHALTEICRLTFLDSYFRVLQEIMEIRDASECCRYHIEDTEITFFNVGSENVCQSGFKMTLPDGKTIVDLGDEALTRVNMSHAAEADMLICGAFCRYADRDIYKPYEKHHWTVKDVAEIAAEIHIGNLVLIHSEDRTPDKPEAYRAEAAEYFSGTITIPTDGDILTV